jgi:P4 family phage/plasmid primase-like protien
MSTILERGDHVELAQGLLAELERECTPLVGDEARIHGYRKATGIYTPIEPSRASVIVQTFAGAEVAGLKRPLSIKASDVSGAARLAYDRIARPGFFTGARPGLAFKNGFVSVSADSVKLVAHSPEHRARFSYAFDYAGNRPPIAFLRFLHDLFRDDADRDAKIMCIQEHVGASLVGQATRYQRALLPIGEGGEGKSTLANIIVRAFPPGSVEAIAPQDWGQEYRRAMLAGKLLNIVAELPEADILESEAFKAIITGDPIVGRHIREAPFTFRPIAGHLFAANRLPGTNDQTEGFWRRLIVIRFNRNFHTAPECDPQIGEKIIAAELPLVVAWMLEGASRIMRERAHTVPSSHVVELDAWRTAADQIRAFLNECTADDSTGYGTSASAIYIAYQRWAHGNGHRPVSSTKFGMRMKAIGKGAMKGRAGNSYPVALAAEGEATNASA